MGPASTTLSGSAFQIRPILWVNKDPCKFPSPYHKSPFLSFIYPRHGKSFLWFTLSINVNFIHFNLSPSLLTQLHQILHRTELLHPTNHPMNLLCILSWAITSFLYVSAQNYLQYSSWGLNKVLWSWSIVLLPLYSMSWLMTASIPQSFPAKYLLCHHLWTSTRSLITPRLYHS